MRAKTSRRDIPLWLERTWDNDPKTRRAAVHALCPCETKVHEGDVWRRLIAMVDDPDPGVRGSICHALCDGSPAAYEPDVLACLDKLRNDSDLKVRKQARRVLAAHRASGRVNIL
jgi:hypothetical protein